MIRLRQAQSAEFRYLRPFDRAVLIYVPEYHLFLLNRIEADLSNIIGLLSNCPVHLGTQRVSSAAAGSMCRDQTQLNQFFQHSPDLVFGFLYVWCQIASSKSAFLPQAVKNDQAVQRHGAARALLFPKDHFQKTQVGFGEPLSGQTAAALNGANCLSGQNNP